MSGFTDRYGLALSTSSQVAAERYVEAVDLFHSGNLGGEELLAEAIQADEGFALPHARLAFRHMSQGRPVEAKDSAERARALAGGITRREQQHIEVIAAQVTGEGERAKVLARQHVAEFPRDMVIFF